MPHGFSQNVEGRCLCIFLILRHIVDFLGAKCFADVRLPTNGVLTVLMVQKRLTLDPCKYHTSNDVFLRCKTCAKQLQIKVMMNCYSMTTR